MDALICTGDETLHPESPGHSPKISDTVKAQAACPESLPTQQRTVPLEHFESTQGDWLKHRLCEGVWKELKTSRESGVRREIPCLNSWTVKTGRAERWLETVLRLGAGSRPAGEQEVSMEKHSAVALTLVWSHIQTSDS